MERIIRILLGVVLIGYGVYSQNYWFFLGVMPLITGLTNYCPIKAIMTNSKDEDCCNKDDEKPSCCSVSDEDIKKFTVEKE